MPSRLFGRACLSCALQALEAGESGPSLVPQGCGRARRPGCLRKVPKKTWDSTLGN